MLSSLSMRLCHGRHTSPAHTPGKCLLRSSPRAPHRSCFCSRSRRRGPVGCFCCFGMAQSQHHKQPWARSIVAPLQAILGALPLQAAGAQLQLPLRRLVDGSGPWGVGCKLLNCSYPLQRPCACTPHTPGGCLNAASGGGYRAHNSDHPPNPTPCTQHARGRAGKTRETFQGPPPAGPATSLAPC